MIKRLSEEVVFKSKLFTIKDTKIQLEDETIVTYQIMEKKDTALLVPINNKGNLLLIKEFYNAINEYQLGLPKGRIELGLDDKETANKELQEEIGYKAKKLDKLGIVTMSPGYFTQRTHIFLARDLVPSKLDGDEPEELEIIEYPFADFEKLIDEGKLTESRMISALYIAKKFLENS